MRVAGRCLALLGLVLLSAAPRAEGAPGTPVQSSTTAGSLTSTATEARARTLAGLERELQDLRALVHGTGAAEVTVSNLFEVNLEDQPAVERRIAQLERELARTSTRGISRLGLARLERDRLRLELLRRPKEERSRLLLAEQQRRRLIDERQAADVALAEAQAREARAEAARLEALEAARQARTVAERILANERARFESARSALASAEGALAGQRQEAATVLARELEQIRQLDAEIHDPALGEASADRLYDRVTVLLERRRQDLSRALFDVSDTAPRDRYEPSVDLSSTELDALAEARDLLRQEIEQHRVAESGLFEQQRDFLVGNANETGSQVNRLNRLRLELRASLSREKYSRLTSLTREGVSQIQRELSHLILLIRWYFRARLARLLSPETLFSDLFAVGFAGWTLLKAVFVVALAFYLRGRKKRWFRLLRRQLIARAKSHASAFWFDRWLSALEAIGGEIIFLAAVVIVFRVLLERGAVPELDLLGDLLLAFGIFRLVLAVLHRSVTQAAEARSIAVSPELSQRIYRSMRLLLSYGFAVYLYLSISEAVLGRGNLHGIAASFAWVGVIPIGTVLVAHWRTAIVESFLANHPEGSLAGFVRRTRDQRRGFFAALLAFGFVAARGVFVYGRETALGFDNTRRALAYFFRRRLEKQAEAGGRRPTDLNLLPHALTTACSDEELRDEGRVENFPELDEVTELARTWRGGGPGRIVSVVGEPGIGKTAWMQALLRALEAPPEIHSFAGRHVGESAALSALARAAGVETGGGRAALIAALRALPPRLFVLDRCHALFLRSIGGLVGYEACLDVAARTTDRHFWVLGHADRPWSFLRKVFRGENHFDRVVTLEEWSEEEISALIDQRMALAGVTPVYDDLVIDRVEGTAFDREVIRSGERFRRLLWDYADGNPRVALHFWLRSLSPDGHGRVRVHLFDAPTADDLEHLQELTRFILAALVLHDDLTAEEVAAALAFTPAQCEAALRFLAKDEILVQKDGRYRVSTHWFRAVGRYLKRKGLIIA